MSDHACFANPDHTQPRKRKMSGWLSASVAALALLLVSGPGWSAEGEPASSSAAAPAEIMARTQGGLREGAHVLRVTTLADDGPGSLRAALTATGPRIVVFEVSGYLDLARRIDVRTPFLTVAGQTAPDPGIVVRGAGIAIRTHDVRLEHFAIYPGVAPAGTDPSEVDALSLISRASRQNVVRNVVLRHLTLAQGTDENLSFAGDAIGQVRLESSLIAKGLREAGHPRVSHSMGFLIYPNVRDVSVVGNIFANNDRRNPVINPGVEVVVANNLVFGYGRSTINVQRRSSDLALLATIRGNFVMPNAESTCGLDPVQVPPGVYLRAPEAVLHLADNVLDGRFARDQECAAVPGLHRLSLSKLVPEPPVVDPDWRIMPASDVRAFTLAHAGMRPARRHPLDAGILRGVADGTGRMINSAEDDGGWPAAPGTTRRLSLPTSEAPADDANLARLATWLCDLHREVGGQANRDCPAPR